MEPRLWLRRFRLERGLDSGPLDDITNENIKFLQNEITCSCKFTYHYILSSWNINENIFFLGNKWSFLHMFCSIKFKSLALNGFR